MSEFSQGGMNVWGDECQTIHIFHKCQNEFVKQIQQKLKLWNGEKKFKAYQEKFKTYQEKFKIVKDYQNCQLQKSKLIEIL